MIELDEATAGKLLNLTDRFIGLFNGEDSATIQRVRRQIENRCCDETELILVLSLLERRLQDKPQYESGCKQQYGAEKYREESANKYMDTVSNLLACGCVYGINNEVNR